MRRLSRILVLSTLLAAACGPTDRPAARTTHEAPSFEIVVPHPNVELYRGETAMLQVSATEVSDGLGAIDLELQGLPAGVTAAPVQIEAGRSYGWLTIAATSDADSGASEIEVVASAGDEHRSQRATLKIRAPGAPVRSFGDAGTVRLGTSGSPVAITLDDRQRTLVLLADQGAARLIRFLPDGAPDPTFDSERRLSIVPAHAIARVNDRVYVAGSNGSDAVVFAMDDTGRPIEAFGGDGGAVVHDAPGSVAIQGASGTVLDLVPSGEGVRLAGIRGADGFFYLIEIAPTGSVVHEAFRSYPGIEGPFAALIQENGVLFTDSAPDVVHDRRVAVVFRFNDDASKDDDFGLDGVAWQYDSEYVALAPSTNGGFYGCGSIVRGEPFPVIDRYAGSGDPDAGFGIGGHLMPPIDSPWGTCLAIAPSKSGTAFVIGRDPTGPMELQQVRADGSLDPRFGDAGSVGFSADTTPVIARSENDGVALAYRAGSDLVIARYAP